MTTASERARKKAGGSDPNHPADGHNDPLSTHVSDQTETAEAKKKPKLKTIGGSDSDKFNRSIVDATLSATWVANPDREQDMTAAVVHSLVGVAPADEVEGMIAGQMVAMHQATMECLRRATLSNQTFEGREAGLNQANKASRTFATLLDTLNRHRAKGQQRVVVEHVHRHIHVHESGPAIVGAANSPGGGGQIEKVSQPHEQQAIGYAIEPALRGEDPDREPVPLSGDAERSMSPARRSKPRRTEGTG